QGVRLRIMAVNMPADAFEIAIRIDVLVYATLVGKQMAVGQLHQRDVGNICSRSTHVKPDFITWPRIIRLSVPGIVARIQTAGAVAAGNRKRRSREHADRARTGPVYGLAGGTGVSP